MGVFPKGSKSQRSLITRDLENRAGESDPTCPSSLLDCSHRTSLCLCLPGQGKQVLDLNIDTYSVPQRLSAFVFTLAH